MVKKQEEARGTEALGRMAERGGPRRGTGQPRGTGSECGEVWDEGGRRPGPGGQLEILGLFKCTDRLGKVTIWFTAFQDHSGYWEEKKEGRRGKWRARRVGRGSPRSPDKRSGQR